MIQSTLPDFKRGSGFNSLSAKEMQRLADATEKMHTMTVQDEYLDMTRTPRGCSIGLREGEILRHVRQRVASQPEKVTVDTEAKPDEAVGFWITADDFNNMPYFGEYDRFRNAINPNRFDYTSDGRATDIGGGVKFVYVLGETELLYEFDAVTFTPLRRFQMSWFDTSSGYPFPVFPVRYRTTHAIAATDDMMVVIGDDGSGEPEELAIVDFVGTDRVPTLRDAPKRVQDIVSGSGVPSDAGIRAIAIGDGFLNVASGNGLYFKIDITTMKVIGRSFNAGGTPTGAKIINGLYFVANVDTSGINRVEQRNLNTFSLIKRFVAQIPALQGLG